jgi:hypothetical protein
MSAAVDLLATVRAMGGDVKLASPGRLKVVAPAPLPNELIDGLRSAKDGLLTLLTYPKPSGLLNDGAEAIIEYDGGAPRAWAEALARLDPNNAPDDVPSQRWLRFIDDGGRFLDGGWADKAADLGWGPLDLFGCDRKRPFARIDHLGLLWRIDGGTVLEMNRDHAVIETVGGVRQTYRRRPVEVGRVMLAWELMGFQK